MTDPVLWIDCCPSCPSCCKLLLPSACFCLQPASAFMATAADAIAQAADAMENLDPAQIEAGRPDGAPEVETGSSETEDGPRPGEPIGQGTLVPTAQAAPAADAAHAAHAAVPDDALMIPEARVIQQREEQRQHAAEAVQRAMANFTFRPIGLLLSEKPFSSASCPCRKQSPFSGRCTTRRKSFPGLALVSMLWWCLSMKMARRLCGPSFKFAQVTSLVWLNVLNSLQLKD